MCVWTVSSTGHVTRLSLLISPWLSSGIILVNKAVEPWTGWGLWISDVKLCSV